MITFTFYFMGAAAIMDFPQIQPFCGSLRLGTSMDNEVHILGMLHAKFHVLFTIWTIYLFWWPYRLYYRIKQEYGYQESKSIITKNFKIITNNHSLTQSQQLTQSTDIQEEEIRMSTNLPYVEGTTEKLSVYSKLIK